MLPRLVEAAAPHAPLRHGLPLGFLSHAGSAAAHRPPTAERRAFEQRVAESLRRVLQLTTERADLTAALAHEAADTIGADFMQKPLAALWRGRRRCMWTWRRGRRRRCTRG